MAKRLIYNWRAILIRSYSSISSFIATVLLMIYTLYPTFDSLPKEFRDFIPTEYLPQVTIFFTVLAIVSRLIRQESLEDRRRD